ncbi:MAG: peptidase [Gammaproteobacteria bacterium]|jgi:putative proteasome-type protease|nr:peptidase [Gammaproteobacteria bacterium]
MTYCVSIAVNDGLVFCSDSRTNAGPDQIATYSKMHRFDGAAGRFFMLLTAGNLSTTQSVVRALKRGIEENAEPNLYSFEKFNDAAAYVGDISREIQQRSASAVNDKKVDTSATLILGGQIGDGKPRCCLIYPEGNFISTTRETPYLQIGESKYGKPILDRIITRETSLADSARCAIVSMDSTLKSNATVGPPIEVLVYERGGTAHYIRLDEDDEYLRRVRQAWNEKIKQAFSELPSFSWERRDRHGELHAIDGGQT